MIKIKIDVIDRLVAELLPLGISDKNKLRNVLTLFFYDYDVSEKKNEVVLYEGNNNALYVKRFLVTKLAEGRTKNTLRYYENILKQFFERCNKPFENMTADDIICYLADCQLTYNKSKVTCNNERRVLNSFFSYLLSRDVISKNPMVSINKIKEEKIIKRPLSPTEIERIRNGFHKKINNLTNKRRRFLLERFYLIFELLLSTGMRVDELCNVELSKVDVVNGEITIMGKGRKERVVYLNPKSKLLLQDYMKEYDNHFSVRKWLFPSIANNANHIGKSAVETKMRKIGEEENVELYPHKLRRTFATTALNRGMPIDQVAFLLGHSNAEVTSKYAITNSELAKANHKKLM